MLLAGAERFPMFCFRDFFGPSFLSVSRTPPPPCTPIVGYAASGSSTILVGQYPAEMNQGGDSSSEEAWQETLRLLSNLDGSHPSSSSNPLPAYYPPPSSLPPFLTHSQAPIQPQSIFRQGLVVTNPAQTQTQWGGGGGATLDKGKGRMSELEERALVMSTPINYSSRSALSYQATSTATHPPSSDRSRFLPPVPVLPPSLSYQVYCSSKFDNLPRSAPSASQELAIQPIPAYHANHPLQNLGMQAAPSPVPSRLLPAGNPAAWSADEVLERAFAIMQHIAHLSPPGLLSCSSSFLFASEPMETKLTLCYELCFISGITYPTQR